jgi:hypothetical protein
MLLWIHPAMKSNIQITITIGVSSPSSFNEGQTKVLKLARIDIFFNVIFYKDTIFVLVLLYYTGHMNWIPVKTDKSRNQKLIAVLAVLNLAVLVI